MSVYLDYVATTPLSPAAARAMAPYLDSGGTDFGNANSLYRLGRQAFSQLEDARSQVARSLGCSRPDEVVFTSGATEADNAAIIGLALSQQQKRVLQGKGTGGCVVMSRIEHHAVLHTKRMLEALGFRVAYVENDAQGRVSVESLERAIDDDTLLVSVMAANNEIATVQDVKSLAVAAHKRGVLFHTDAVQALGKMPVNVRDWGVDAASFSAHKVGGPKGMGVLYVKTGVSPMAYMAGGGQERGLRSGTQNVMGAVGTAAAVAEAVRMQPEFEKHARELQKYAYERLCGISGVTRTVDRDESVAELPNIVNVCVRGWESQSLVLRLDRLGYCVSGGSACSSNSLEPSHVLTALGIEEKRAQTSLRVSIGAPTTKRDIDGLCEALESVVKGR